MLSEMKNQNQKNLKPNIKLDTKWTSPAIEAPTNLDANTKSVPNEEKPDDKIDSTFVLTQEVADGAVKHELDIHEDEDFGSLEILDRDIDLESSRE